MKWTEAQRSAIELRNTNILVSAAAGSGKTAVLVERIKRLILEEQVSLNEMLIVTFSNAAAAEMKAKITAAVAKELEQVDGSRDKQQFLRRQLNLIYKANISTFHAFAMEVIRRYFPFAGIDPDFKICDEAQKTILQSEALEQLFSELFQIRDQDFFDFLQCYAGSKNENTAKEMLLSGHRFIQSIPKPFAWLEKQVAFLNQPWEEFLQSAVCAQLKENTCADLQLTAAYLEQVQSMLDTAGLTELCKKAELDLKGIESLLEEAVHLDLEQLLSRMAAFSFQRFTAVKAEKESYGLIKEDVSAVREKGKAVLKKACEQLGGRTLFEAVEELRGTYPQALCFQRLLLGFDRIYREKKEKKGLLDFSDIEHYALEILEHEEVAAEYREKFRYIFIDEYQDSNVIQETLIGCIKRKDNVFMVGDVKQSIYKFRLAEPELFIGKYEACREGKNPCDRKVDLNQNFRSKGGIIDGINHIFRSIMNVQTTGLDYDDAAALYRGVENDPQYDYPVSLHVVDDSIAEEDELDDEIAEMKRMEVEAYAAVQLLRQAYGKRIYDSKKGCERTVTYRDMVILLRSAKTSGQIYFQVLADAGIPGYIDESDGYFDTIEIQVFLNLLRVLDNGSQDLPLLSIMRSPILDFDLDEMAKIRIACRRGSYYGALEAYGKNGGEPELQKKVAETLDRLAKWRKQKTYMPLEDFLWMLLRETGYERFVSAIPGGTQRSANLRALVDKAVQYQSGQMKGLFGFIRYVEALQSQKVSMGEVKLIGEQDDVVRIMTIHKSKGLEFPVVLLGGLGKRLGGGRDLSAAVFHRELGLGLRLVDPQRGIYTKTLLQSMIERRKKKEEMAEEIRILYVAFTRAMDELILLGSVADIEEAGRKYQARHALDAAGAKSYLDFLIPALDGSGIEVYHHTRSGMSLVKKGGEAQKEQMQHALQEGFAQAQASPGWEPELARRFSYTYAHEELRSIKSKYTVSELVKRGTGKPDRFGGDVVSEAGVTAIGQLPKFLQEEHAFTAAERGTILHSIMEFIPFGRMREAAERRDRAALTQLTAGFVEKMAALELLSQQEADAADTERIVGFFLSEIGQRACAAEKVYKETPFNLKWKVDGHEVLVQGVIDCYFKEADGYVLLDYKSNRVWEGASEALKEKWINELKESYMPQLHLYEQALIRIKGIKVKERYLYAFSLGEGILLSKE